MHVHMFTCMCAHKRMQVHSCVCVCVIPEFGAAHVCVHVAVAKTVSLDASGQARGPRWQLKLEARDSV